MLGKTNRSAAAKCSPICLCGISSGEADRARLRGARRQFLQARALRAVADDRQLGTAIGQQRLGGFNRHVGPFVGNEAADEQQLQGQGGLPVAGLGEASGVDPVFDDVVRFAGINLGNCCIVSREPTMIAALCLSVER